MIHQIKTEWNAWVGRVVSIEDPLHLGRCKVKILGIYSKDLDPVSESGSQLSSDTDAALKVPTSEQLPWCYPGGFSVFGAGSEWGAGSYSAPKLNSIVKVVFFAGDEYAPEYYSVAMVGKHISEWIADSPKNSHVLLWDKDEDVRVAYKPGPDAEDNLEGKRGGLTIWKNGSYFSIKPDDTIDIMHSKAKTRVLMMPEEMYQITEKTMGFLSNDTMEFESKSKIKSFTKTYQIKCDQFQLDASQSVSIKAGQSVTIECGSSIIEITASGIKISGAQIATQATAEAKIDAAKIAISASGILQLGAPMLKNDASITMNAGPELHSTLQLPPISPIF
jgi:hypothetical protein